MTKLSILTRQTLRFLEEKTPELLTVAAVSGTVSTIFLTVKGTFRAAEELFQGEEPDTLTTKEKVVKTWHFYIPAGVSAGLTIAAILSMHGVHAKRQAAILGLYSISERALNEYKDKVVEIVGEKKADDIREDIVKDRLEATPLKDSQVFITGTGENLCYDMLSGRYFKSDIETLRKAQNDLNVEVINGMYAAHNDFYRAVGLPPISLGEEYGWRSDHLMDLSFSTHLSEDGKPCLAVDYHVAPIRGYWKSF